MNQFEEARLRAQKRQERQAKYQEQPAPVEQAPVPTPAVEVPKAKPRHEAIIEVKVILPDREISVTLQKINVYENVNKSRLNKSEIKRCVENGFAPLMGRLNDLPGSR